MHVLIAYGSKMGGTEGLARMLGHALREGGIDVDVMAAPQVPGVSTFDAVILGGAIYNGRWHKDARRFAKRHRLELRDRPVWLFSSGPLDDSAVTGDIAPVRHVAKVAADIGAEGHMTFGGRLPDDATGFLASGMAKTMAGDWRDKDQVRDWAKRIGEELAIE